MYRVWEVRKPMSARSGDKGLSKRGPLGSSQVDLWY